MVNSHEAVEVETAIVLHARLWLQFDPKHINAPYMNLFMKPNLVYG